MATGVDVGSRARLESIHDLVREPPLQQALDTVEKRALFRRNQRDGSTFAACSSGASDTVNVVFRDVW